MDMNGERTILRSINNDHPSWVRFVNTTCHEVEIFWINYEGQAVSYGKLQKSGSQMRSAISMRTYVTHPWIFVDATTMERFLCNGKDVFYPTAWELNAIGRAQPRPHFAYITIPMYTLREMAMKTIKTLLKDDNDAYLLHIPHNLQRELANMTPRENRSL